MPASFEEFISSDYDPVAECRALLADMQAKHEARQVGRKTARLSYEEAAALYAPGCKLYTRLEADLILAKIQTAGYPKAQLIGSVAARGESTKDVDILIPLRYRTQKTACIQVMREVFIPSCLSVDCRGTDGFGMVAEPFGVLDFFFNTRGFTYGLPH